MIVFLVTSQPPGDSSLTTTSKNGPEQRERFKGLALGNSARIYAIPHAVQVGGRTEPRDIAAELRHAGYSDQSNGPSHMGNYRLLENAIEIKPGPDSDHSQESAVIRVPLGCECLSTLAAERNLDNR